MRQVFERELQTIGGDFIRMISHTQEQLSFAGQVLLETKTELAKTVHEQDKEVDALEIKLENACLLAFATQQPVAGDLRLLTAVFKSLTDLERIGDYAKHVADDGKLLSEEPPLKRYINLGQMIERLKTMLENLARAFSERDAKLAAQVLAMDDEVDDLYEQTQRELVTYMIEDPRTITKALALLRVGRSLERIGDHIENVAERLQYWLTGERASLSQAEG